MVYISAGPRSKKRYRYMLVDNFVFFRHQPNIWTSRIDLTMQAEPCLQWPKGQCRRHTTCKYYHAPLEIPPLRPGQCSWLKNGAKRCESNATYVENDLPLCFDHTESGRSGQKAAVGDKRTLLAPERVTKRVSGKSRMVNPYEVGYLVGGAKKADFDKVSATQFTDPSRPMIVDVGSAQGRFLIQLAQCHQNAKCDFNYVGFELRSNLVDAANSAVASSSLNGSVVFLQGDAKANMIASLAPVVAPTVAQHSVPVPEQLNSTDKPETVTENTATDTTNTISVANKAGHVEWLTIQFPDPWTKKKHHKRRLVDTQFVNSCAELITHPQGKVYLCSDRYDLACFMYDTFAASALWRVISSYEALQAQCSNHVSDINTHNAYINMHADGTSADKVDTDDNSVRSEDSDHEDTTENAALPFGADVYRNKDANDTRCWLEKRPFPVGTERDSVAEKKNRPVHRAIFIRNL